MKKGTKTRKQKIRSRNFLSGKTLFVLLLLITLPFVVFASNQSQNLRQNAQDNPSPAFCMGACPTLAPSSTDSPNVTSAAPIPSEIVDPQSAPISGTTQQPCGDNAVTTDNAHISQKNIIEQLFELILNFFKRIIELLFGSGGTTPPGQQTPDDPTPPVETIPTTAPQPGSGNPVPSANPCPPQVATQIPVEPTAAAVLTSIPVPSSAIPSSIAPSIAAVSGAAPGGPVPASTNTCGGKYSLNNSLHKNFGDPLCKFTKNDLYAWLKKNDPANAAFWFNTVVPCESSYNPNAFAPPVGVQARLDSAGAWGLYQMGRGKNGPLDHGDVEYHLQTTNAINYNNKVIKGNWRYWACARSRWK